MTICFQRRFEQRDIVAHWRRRKIGEGDSIFPHQSGLRVTIRRVAVLDALTARPHAAVDAWARSIAMGVGRGAGARRLGRPGVYFFSVNYEWGCTCRVAPGADPDTAELIRVLDWRTPGLGRNVVAAHVAGPAGPYLSLTWPGYTGVLQASAPGRFAAAVNQAPMRPLGGGLLPFDWLANRWRVWSLGHLPAAHLLRRVFERAETYADARRMLTETAIAAPAIFSLAGLRGDETCVIERTECEATVFDGRRAAANHWSTPAWTGRGRGIDSAGRARHMEAFAGRPDATFSWLSPPVLNPLTRLAMVASPRGGTVVARGFESDGPATSTLVWRT